jgi:hypothetical protein
VTGSLSHYPNDAPILGVDVADRTALNVVGMRDRQRSEASLARVQAGRNPRYPGFETDPVAAVLLRYREAVAAATEEAFVELVRLGVKPQLIDRP